MIALVLALSLAPALQKQIHDAFAPGDAPASLEVMLSIDDGAAQMLVLCGGGRTPRPLLVRIEQEALSGDPVEIGSGLAGHASCGRATPTAPFEVKRKGAKPARAVVVSFAEEGKPFLAAAVTFAPSVLTWTDAAGAAIVPEQARGETTFCALQRNGAWSRIAWSGAAGDYAPAGRCAPSGKK